ncbi:MAG: hypothetical protein WBJ81_03790 [Rickettsiales bacterium]
MTDLNLNTNSEIVDYFNNGRSISTVIFVYGIEAIAVLNEAGADFTTLNGIDISNIITYLRYENKALEAAQLLKDAGANFSTLDSQNLYNTVRMLTYNHSTAEVIKFLRDAGAPQDGILDPNKLTKIKDLCEPVIQNHLGFREKLDQLLEEKGVFEALKKANVTNIDQAQQFFESMLDPSDFDALSSGVLMDVNGQKVDSFIIHDTNNNAFTAQNLLTHLSKVIDCSLLLNLGPAVNSFAKHGIILDAIPEEEFPKPDRSDAGLEAEYLFVDFTGPLYGSYGNDCKAFAKLNHINETMIEKYCPTETLVDYTADTTIGG